MSESHTSSESDPSKPPALSVHQVSPDDLMNDFKGKPLFNVLVAVLVLHVLVIGVFSYGYIKKQVFGEETKQLTEEEVMNLAVREATAAVREIAEKHGVNKQELASRFGDSNARPVAPSGEGDDTPAEAPETGATPEPDAPAKEPSDIERAVTEQQPGPAVPDLDGDITEEDPIFPE